MRKLSLTLLLAFAVLFAMADSPLFAGGSVHMTYLWHMQQPIYWPADSLVNADTYQKAYESMTASGDPYHPQNDLATIFGKADRVDAYQYSPRDAISSGIDLANMGASQTYPGDLVENVKSLADNGWTYNPSWYSWTREAAGWLTSGGYPRLDVVNFSAHHAISGLAPQEALKKDIQVNQYLVNKYLLGNIEGTQFSSGYFPAETCFSERAIKTLVECGIDWSFVANIHLSRACENYQNTAAGDNCNPPNKADMLNPAQLNWFSRSISRGVVPKNAVPFAYQPHYAKYVDPDSGTEYKVIVVPTAQAMGWEDGYACYGTGDMETIAGMAPGTPMIVVLAHDGDNAFGGGWTYYNECVTNLTHSAAGIGFEPLVTDQYLADHPVDIADIVKVEDGGWVNADGDFGAPRYINWLWPPINYVTGNIDVITGWGEDFRNWAVIIAGVNRVKTAEDLSAAVRISRVADPANFIDATSAELAWHKLLPAMTAGYMYYGTSLDMEVKPSVACNAAVSHADSVIGSTDNTAPTILVPQRQPYNPGGYGNGALWGWTLTPMSKNFYVWTFIYDVSGLYSSSLKYRVDADGVNLLSDNENETYTGGAGVGAWQSIAMTQRAGSTFVGNIFNDPEVNFDIMPQYIADEYYAQITGFTDTLLDYYVEAVDNKGNVAKSDIQHVWVGNLTGGDSPPTVSITSPLNGAIVSATVNVTANASDDIGVAKVEFSIDGVLKSTDTTSPYAYSWDTTTETEGTHSITAKAYDTIGQTATDSITVTVDNVPGGGMTVHAEYTHIHYWGTADGSTTWPGIAMTSEGGGWYYYTFATSTCANIVFSNNGSPQTPDLYRCGDGWYQNGVWYNSKPVVDSPPTVSITSPLNGAIVSATVSVTANASDDIGVNKVEFSIDGVLKSTDTTSPYEYSWDTTVYADGSHSITAKAYDTIGQTATDSITVTVDNVDELPTVSITSPLNGATVSGTVAVTANASDDNGVNKVEFSIDGVLKSTDTTSPYEYSWDATVETDGSHSITAKAYDTIGQTTTDSITVTVDNAPTGYLSAYSSVALPGTWNGWNPAGDPMTLIADWTWQGEITFSSGSKEYKFAMDGGWGTNRGLGNSSGPNLPQTVTGLTQDGANIPINVPAGTVVFTYYEDIEESTAAVK